MESQLHSNILEEVGYEQGDYSEFIEGVPNIVDEAFQQTNNGVQSPIQNLNITPSISHGRKCTPKRIQVDESVLSSMEGKMPQRTIRRHCSEIITLFFEPKSSSCGEMKLTSGSLLGTHGGFVSGA